MLRDRAVASRGGTGPRATVELLAFPVGGIGRRIEGMPATPEWKGRRKSFLPAQQIPREGS